MQQEEFKKGLDKALNTARTNGNCLTEQQVREIFGDVYEDEKHKEILMAYFKSKNISILAPGQSVPDAEYEKNITDQFSFDPGDKRYLDGYLDGLEKIDRLGDAEMTALILRCMDNDMEAKGLLLEQYLSKAADLAKTYTGQGMFMEDLIGQANLALTEAVMEIENHIDPEGTVEELLSDVDGYLGTRMMDAIEYMIDEERGMVDADNEMAGKINLVADSARELSEDLGRKVSIRELSENTSLSEEEIRTAVRILGKGIGDTQIEPEDE
ncbi:MAG: hypothetical protein J5842_07290 [Lachnospiraceae bacterium]|nr:hypothetical protein [Lachnospiraceae bacterium]